MYRPSLTQLYNFRDDNDILPVFAAAAELYTHVSENFKGPANDAALGIVFEGLRVRLKTMIGDDVDDEVFDSLIELVTVIR